MPLDLKTYSARLRVTDGAWGTQLQALGLPAGHCPELWNIDNPPAIRQVADSYVQAGSDVILTNTFGANRFILSQHGAGGRVKELAAAGARISRLAADKTGAKVFGSIGPTGKIVMMQDVPDEQIMEAFAEQAIALADGGVDAIVLETFNELQEAVLALRAIKKSVKLPVVVSLTFASGPDKTSTMMGDTPEALGVAAVAGGADAVGANCGVGPDNYVKVASMLRSACDLPVWIKANAGLPVVAGGKTTFPMSPQQFAAVVPDLLKAGANFIGGCCGTNPEFIRSIRKAVG
ncbi:MAG: homocysteine S-methyltransferase family protein [Planctomycetes bacterium]|nr:homocysteine S-methyltransferase family protein [Planctomycetota bacterium]